MNKKVTHRALKLNEVGDANCAVIGARFDHKTGLMHFLDIRDDEEKCKCPDVWESPELYPICDFCKEQNPVV